jgi:hypothetical protein
LEKIVTLKWEKTGTYFELLSNYALLEKHYNPQSCVYLHTNEYSGLTCISYIGQTKKGFANRQFHHFKHYISGLYPILDERGKWIQPSSRDLYKRKEINKDFLNIILDQNKYLDIIKLSRDYTKKVNIYSSIINEELNKVCVKDIEKILIKDLEPLENIKKDSCKEKILIQHEGVLDLETLKKYKENKEKLGLFL